MLFLFRNMKSTVLLSAIVTLLCVIQKIESTELDDVLVRPDDLDNKPSLFQIPRNTWELARMKHFVQVPLERSFRYKMRLFCFPRDPRFCVFYDYLGNIAGVQISFLKADVRNVSSSVYNYTAVKDFVHTNFFGIPAYSSRIYFTQPDRLTEAGRRNISEVIDDGLWTTIDRKLIKISRCRPNGPRFGTFKLQGCYPKIGTIYINKFGPSDSCKEGYFLFVLFDKYGSLVGLGIFAPGYGTPGPLRDWYSHANEDAVKRMVPAPPRCFKDMKRFNFSAILVFLIDKLKIEDIRCLDCNL